MPLWGFAPGVNAVQDTRGDRLLCVAMSLVGVGAPTDAAQTTDAQRRDLWSEQRSSFVVDPLVRQQLLKITSFAPRPPTPALDLIPQRDPRSSVGCLCAYAQASPRASRATRQQPTRKAADTSEGTGSGEQEGARGQSEIRKGSGKDWVHEE
jgi:hypothetical protein